MLEKLKTFFNDFSQWRNLFVHETKTISTNGICCIDILPTSFSIAFARYDKGQANLILCGTYAYNTKEDLISALVTIVKYHQLDTVNCAWILQSDQYQVLLNEALPVPANEFQAAIRWKIKDLVRFPMTDAIIDSFSLPIKKPSSVQAMIMVVVAKASELKMMAETLEQSGLNLNKISILELSLRNISALYDQDDKPTALIYMQDNSTQLIITCKKQLHFARKIELGVGYMTSTSSSSLTEAEIITKIDRLALEIQRSFDYYQSQWRQVIPVRIVFSSVRLPSFDIVTLLSQRLSIPVEMLNMSKYFTGTNIINVEEQGKYLPIIGEIIHHEGNNNAARN